MNLKKGIIIGSFLSITFFLTACSSYEMQTQLPKIPVEQLPSDLYLNKEGIRGDEIIAIVEGKPITAKEISLFIDVEKASSIEYFDEMFTPELKKERLTDDTMSLIYSKAAIDKALKENWLNGEHKKEVEGYRDFYKKDIMGYGVISTAGDKKNIQRYEEIMKVYGITEEDILSIIYNSAIADYYMYDMPYAAEGNLEVPVIEDTFRKELSKDYDIQINYDKLNELIK